MVRPNHPPGAQSIIRAVRLLKALKHGESSLEELCEKVDLNRSTAHRILKALASEGLVEQDAHTKAYSLGYEVLELSAAARQQISIRKSALPILNELSERTHETIHLSVRTGVQVVCIEKVQSPRPVRIVSEIGTTGPLYCTGSGKCLLAFLPESDIDRILADIEFKAFTDHTITNRDELKKQLVEIRKEEVAYDFGEHQAEIMCVAAPVYDNSGRVIAAISLAVPVDRCSPEKLKEFEPLVSEAACKLSAKLGYLPAHFERRVSC